MSSWAGPPGVGYEGEPVARPTLGLSTRLRTGRFVRRGLSGALRRDATFRNGKKGREKSAGQTRSDLTGFVRRGLSSEVYLADRFRRFLCRSIARLTALAVRPF